MTVHNLLHNCAVLCAALCFAGSIIFAGAAPPSPPVVRANQIPSLCAKMFKQQTQGDAHRIQLLHPAPLAPGQNSKLGFSLQARNCTVVCTDASHLIDGGESYVEFALACLAQYPSEYFWVW